MACAAVGLVLSVIPFYLDVPAWVAAVAIVVGVAGAGLAGDWLVRGFSPTALAAVTASGLAVVLATVAVLVDANAVADAAADPFENMGRYGVNYNTASVLEHELDVSFGTFTAKTSTSRATGRPWVSDSRLPVTVRNKLDKKRSFNVTIAGFDGNHQIAEASEDFILGPGAEQTIDFFDLGLSLDAAQQLKTAQLRVIEAHSGDK